MKTTRWTWTDWFFGFQVVMAWFFAVPQFLQVLKDVRGVTIVWLLCADIFVILNLFLTCGTVKRNRSKDTVQALVIYANWVLLFTPIVVLTFFKCTWTQKDSVVLALVAILTASLLVGARLSGKSIRDPVVKGLLVGIFRVAPHLYMTWCIIQAGSGAGIATKAIVAANITATARIITLVYTGRKTGWDRGLISSLLSEVANEGTWLLVTVTWLLH